MEGEGVRMEGVRIERGGGGGPARPTWLMGCPVMAVSVWLARNSLAPTPPKKMRAEDTTGVRGEEALRKPSPAPVGWESGGGSGGGATRKDAKVSLG